MVYACIFILRAWLLPTVKFEQMMQFMTGDVSDLADSSSIGAQMTVILQETLKVPEITLRNVLNIMGIKRTNANSLKVGGRQGTALYTLYPLMNSHCYCNTRYTLSGPDFLMEGKTGSIYHASMHMISNLCSESSAIHSQGQ